MRNLTINIMRTLYLTAFAALFTVSGAWAQGLPMGSAMPGADVVLARAGGGDVKIGDLKGERGTVVVFWSNQCPWVDKYEDRVLGLAGEFRARGISFVLVNANDPVAFPQESVAASEGKGYDVPYLADSGSELAGAFGAERTPHVYVFDAADALVYVGAIDDSPGDPGNVKEEYLRSALDAVVQGAAPATARTKAFGCTVKMKQ